MHATAALLNKLGDELKAAFFEREDVIDACLLALVSGQHIMLLGEPGVAKTNVVRHLFHAIIEARKFEVQLTKRTPNEKVSGPIDLVRLRENGEYVHKREGYVTWADLVLLDEIGKASAVVGHELLTLLADRLFHEVANGRSAHESPLHAAFCPSNEIPTHESDEAAALYDRLLIRVPVEDIKDKRNFLAMLTSDVPLPTTQIAFDDIRKVTETELPQVELTREAAEGIVNLREKFSAQGITLSSRRWRWSMQVLRAAAFLSGSKKIEEHHLVVLRHTLWDEYEQIEVANQLCSAAANPFYEALSEQVSLVGEVEKALNDRAGDKPALMTYGAEGLQKLATVRDALDALLTEAGDRTILGFAKAADRHRAALVRAFVECMEQPVDIAEISAERRLGLGGGTVVTVEVS